MSQEPRAALWGRPATQRGDLEFLPAAIEILETPPSPVAMRLLAAICLLLISALAWSYFGHVDVIATAHGKIEPDGRVKTIQPLVTGKVAEINVENGTVVHTGDVLLRLEAEEAIAEAARLQAEFIAYKAEVERRRAELAAVNSLHIKQREREPKVVSWTADIPAPIRDREDAVFQGELDQLQATLTGLESEIAERKSAATFLTQTIKKQEDLIATLDDRASISESSLQKGAGSKVAWLDTLQDAKSEAVTLANLNAQLGDAHLGVTVLQNRWETERQAFVAENLQKLNEAERQVEDLGQRLRQALAQVEHTTIRSPLNGTVQGSSITTKGQVVTTGEELMRIVPATERLVVEAYLPNRDIGFVAKGQTADVKIEAFPFTRYGVVPARIVSVATDAIPEPDAKQMQLEPSGSIGRNEALAGGGLHTIDLVYPLTVALDRNWLVADGKEVALAPGMVVTVEVKTGRRRILEYLLSPIVEVTEEAMHER